MESSARLEKHVVQMNSLQQRRQMLVTMMTIVIVVVVDLEMKSFAVEADAAKQLHATTFFVGKKKAQHELLFCFVLKFLVVFFFSLLNMLFLILVDPDGYARLLDLLDLLTQLLLLLGRKGRLETKELSNAFGVLVLDEECNVFGAHLEELFHLQIVGRQHQCKQRIIVDTVDKALLEPVVVNQCETKKKKLR